ncbi:MAG: tRNA pseudouridine(55) synthase TruB [Candidatus Omnitrophica bacterium]|nr:tRNA pseudouridine(55) synthase TruB [Candidatus Omnitrophota bacterium]
MENNKDGIILVNKPAGMTSHDVVDYVRDKLKITTVGHAGTLDPLAEGLLVILVGRATKLFSKFADFDKEYIGVIKLGENTSTGDSEGVIIKKRDYKDVTKEKINEVFNLFKGEIQQIPPMVSALRVGGKRLYALARRGIVVNRKPRKIKIYSLEVISINLPYVEFYTHCSKGTYIRKLAEDIGECLGCGAHVIKIKRLSIGPFRLEDAVNLDQISEYSLRQFAFAK